MSEDIRSADVPTSGQSTQEDGKPDYAALRVKYANHLLSPFRSSDLEWARDHGVTDRTLRNWKADPEFVKLIEDWRSRAKVAIPAMLRSVIDRVIKTGDPNAYRAVMESLGESKQEIDLNLSAPFIKLQEQLVAIRKAALDAERQQQPPTLN